MITQEHEIVCAHPREHVWEELTRIENLARWGAVDDVVAMAAHLEPAQSYVGTLTTAATPLNAALVVTDFEPAERLVLRITSPMAVVHETLDLRSAGEGTGLHYTVDASSQMFGPQVSGWLREHVATVATKLERFARELD